MQEILINIEAGERRVAILRSKKLEWYLVERVNEKRILGNIYKGKVSSVLDGIGAAFIDCGLEKNGFLYISDTTPPMPDAEDAGLVFYPGANQRNDKGRKGHPRVKISNILKKDQDVLVQVTKEEIGTKGARLTNHISLAGRYLVLMPTLKRVGVSRKIRDEEKRRQLRTILGGFKLPKDTGLVVRTAAENCGKRELLKDLNYLLDTYNRVNRSSRGASAPALLFEELDLSLKVIRDMVTEETAKVIVDDKQEYKKLRRFTARIAPGLANKISLYREDAPLFEKYNIEKDIDKLFERKVFLKCGGYITVEQTEGMIAIDVNSGRFKGRKSIEDTVFKVNCEAAKEVARQVLLRDMGGIIVTDFIDMESQEHRKKVFSILQNALRQDPARTHIVPLSELDMVEMTRQRVRRSLESVSYQNCPYCEGRGMVKSAATVVIITLRKLKAFLKTHRSRRASIEVSVHPSVAQRLVNEDAPSLDLLRKRFRRRISVVADDKLHPENSKIQPVN